MGQDARVDPTETGNSTEGRFHPPGDLVIRKISSATGVQATVSGAAGVGGQKAVVTTFAFTVAAATQLAAGTIGCYVIDGASGGTSYLWSEVIAITTTGARVSMNGLNLLGSSNTAVTIEFSAGVTNANQSVNLAYHFLGGGGV